MSELYERAYKVNKNKAHKCSVLHFQRQGKDKLWQRNAVRREISRRGGYNMGIDIDGIKAYSIKDLSKILNVTPFTLRKYVTTGRIKAQKVGRGYMVTHESLKEFLDGTYKPKKKVRK